MQCNVVSQTLAFTYRALHIHITSLLKKQSYHRHMTNKKERKKETEHKRAIQPSYCNDDDRMYMQYCLYNITNAFNHHIHIRTVKLPLYILLHADMWK